MVELATAAPEVGVAEQSNYKNTSETCYTMV